MMLWWDAIKISVTWTYASPACVTACQISPPKEITMEKPDLTCSLTGVALNCREQFLYQSNSPVFNCLGYKSKWKVTCNDCKSLWEKWKSNKYKMLKIIWSTKRASRKICVIYLWVTLFEREHLYLQLSQKKCILQIEMLEAYCTIQGKIKYFHLWR